MRPDLDTGERLVRTLALHTVAALPGCGLKVGHKKSQTLHARLGKRRLRS
jgi:hypothetical protein